MPNGRFSSGKCVSGVLADSSQLSWRLVMMGLIQGCLLYTSDAADELDGVDLGGRRIIKKKKR